MAGRTPLACLAILAVLVAAALFTPTAFAGNICTASLTSCQPLSVYKYGPQYVNAGESATYTFVVNNNTGFDTFSDVTVSDDKCSPVSGPDGDTNSDGKLDYTESWTYTCTYTPAGAPGDVIDNTVTVSGTGEEYGSQTDTASHRTTLTGLGLTKTVDLETADPFDELHYTITISHNGPDNFDYQGYLSDEGCEDLASDDGNTDGNAFWLRPGESVTYTCHHNYDGDGDYTNEACAGAYVSGNQQTLSIESKGNDIEVCDSATTTLAKHKVSGTVFEDLNADGARQLGEPALPGVIVYADKNGNGKRDEGEPFGTSDGQGSYSVEVELGTTTIREEVPGGFTCSFPGGCSYSVDLPKNSAPEPPAVLSRAMAARADDPIGKDFGDWRPASVTGTIVSDDNGNGARDSGEGGLAGIAVFADLNGNGSPDQGEPSTTSAANGAYSLAGLTPGGYTVRHVVAQGRTCTGPAGGCKHDVTLTSGAAAADRDFLDNAPAQAVLGARIIPGVARMTGKTGCAWGSGFSAGIRGKGMLKVVFRLDGRKPKSFSPVRDNRSYKYRVNIRKLGIGPHTVSARVTFRQNRVVKTRTIRLTFQICQRQLRAPQFTG